MNGALESDALRDLAPSGFYIALRVGFAFPMEEVNALPPDWVEHYTRERLMMYDPVIQWIYAHTGAARWSEISFDDPKGVMERACHYGLRHGVAVCCYDDNPEGQRSFGTFARADREYLDDEISLLTGHVLSLHLDKAPPTTLTGAELEALRMLKSGMRLKQIAYELGVSEGAIKQRLKNARLKLDAATAAQAAAKASDYGLI